MITKRDFEILLLVAVYEVLLRSQISALLFKDDPDGRICRKRVKLLVQLGLLDCTNMRVVNPMVMAGVSAPAYFLTAKGAEFLAQETGENSYKLLNTSPPHFLYLYHTIAVSIVHILLDEACKLLGDVHVEEWISERTLANPNEKEPQKRFRLIVRWDEGKLFCASDAAFLLRKKSAAKAHYIELDRDTTKSADRVAASKCNGYARLYDEKYHYKHFAACTIDKFNVLVIAPTERRREALRVALSKKPHAEIYKFASLPNMESTGADCPHVLTAETFLTGNIWHSCDGSEPKALLLKESKEVTV